MGCSTETHREAEFVKKKGTGIEVGVEEDTLFEFLALIHNTENWPFQQFKTRLKGLISLLLVSPSLSIFLTKNFFQLQLT